jgi:serine/threonine-protein kinase RsbW
VRPEPLRLPAGVRARPEALDSVQELLAQAWVLHPDVTAADRMGVETAVVEVAANIIEHGGGAGDLAFEVHVRPERVTALFCDTGILFEADLHGAAMPDDMAEGGRGLALARAVSDEVAYERAGGVNCWRIVRLRGR